MVHGLSCPVACGILVPGPGIEPAYLRWEADLYHSTAREVPVMPTVGRTVFACLILLSWRSRRAPRTAFVPGQGTLGGGVRTHFIEVVFELRLGRCMGHIH